MRHITGGKIYKDGEELHIKSPEHAIAHKIALLTEDRRGNGIVGMLSIKDNTVLASLKNYGFPLNHKKMREDTEEYVRKLNTKTPTIDTPIKNLSGGNQQKVLVGRWLLTDPDILIVDEPTRGIDAAARSDVYSIIRQLKDAGVAVLMVSSDIEEVVELADRAITVFQGRINGEFSREEITQDVLTSASFGIAQERTVHA